jgi:transcriptional regulator with XRE-family HTH domain
MQRSLSTKLRVLRAERGLPLREAADLVGVRPGTLSELERGLRHPHDVTLAKIARGYGVPVEELLEEPVAAGKAEAPEEPGPASEEGKGEGPWRHYVRPDDPVAEISSGEVRDLYGRFYMNLLQAEQESSVEPFLEQGNLTLDLVRAVGKLQPSDEKARLQERVKELLRREMALFGQERERRERHERELREALVLISA